MAASSWNVKCPRILTDAGGEIAPIWTFPEGTATQAYKAGALVYFDATNGRVHGPVANSGLVIGGIAQKDAFGTANTDAPVQIIRPGDRMVFTCYDASDSAETDADNFKAGLTYDIELISGVAYAEVDSEAAVAEQLVFIQAVYDAAGNVTTQGIFQVETNTLNFGESA